MAGTRTDLRTRIADDLVDAPVTTAQIDAAIDDAIRFYEDKRFTFNEVQNVSATLSTSHDSVALTSLPVYFTKIDRFRIRQSSNTQDLSDLVPRDYAWLMSWQDSKTTCRPAEYCIYADALNLDSIPDQNYTAVFDGIKRLAPGSSNSYCASSSVAWFTTGVNLIRYRAEVDLLANVVLNDAEAQKKDMLEKRELSDLKRKLNTRNTGRVRPTDF